MGCRAIWDCPKRCENKCCYECERLEKCKKKDWHCKLIQDSSEYSKCDKYTNRRGNMLILEEGLENGYIHRVFGTGIETWSLYDERNSLIHHIISDGRETWQSYDEKRNIIYAKDKYVDGTIFEQWWEYDIYGRMKSFKNSNGYSYSTV